MGAVTFLFITVALPMTQAGLESSRAARVNERWALVGLSVFGPIALMIMSGIIVTQEFRHKTIMPTLCASPRRSVVMGAKAILISAVTVVLVPLAVMAAFAGLHLVSNPNHQCLLLSGLLPGLGRGIVTMVLVVLLAQGLAYLVRATPVLATIACVVPTALEMIVVRLPQIGEKVQPYLIFANVSHALRGPSEGGHFLWGQWGSILYLAAIATALLVAGFIVMQRRAPSD